MFEIINVRVNSRDAALSESSGFSLEYAFVMRKKTFQPGSCQRMFQASS